MCIGDDITCPDFEKHKAKFMGELGHERRSFLKSAFAAAGGVTAARRWRPLPGHARSGPDGRKRAGEAKYHYLPATAETVHWGYFSKLLKPQVEVDSGDLVTIEALTHHANDDAERMVKGDPGAESVFFWTKEQKNVNRRGAGPMDASIHGRGAGEGFGVHICTGPVFVRGAEPGDVLEVRILDVMPRPSRNPEYAGKAFGSNAAAWWGFHYKDLITEPKEREVITIYEIDATGDRNWAKAVYNYRWTPQTDPFGVVHKHDRLSRRAGRPQHGQEELRHPEERARADPPAFRRGRARAARRPTTSTRIPPSYTGGNIDNWRIGKGATMYYPVAVEGALLSVGDSARLPGRFRAVRHGDRMLADRHVPADPAQEGGPGRHAARKPRLPMLETKDEWLVHGFTYANYLADLGAEAQSAIYGKSSVDGAMRDAFRKMRHFLMTAKGLTEDEAISLMSIGVDFGITQVVDGNFGVHAIIRKDIFSGGVA